jgi:Tat protein translocase TatB subunit
MFNIGVSEMVIICLVALLVFGPDELPQLVKKVARGLGEARRVTEDLRRSIDLVDDDEEDRRARAFARSHTGLSGTTASTPLSSSSAAAAAAMQPPGNGHEAENTAIVPAQPPEPEMIPGSLLTPTHGEDQSTLGAAPAVVIAAPHGRVAVGALDDDEEGLHGAHGTTDAREGEPSRDDAASPEVRSSSPPNDDAMETTPEARR